MHLHKTKGEEVLVCCSQREMKKSVCVVLHLSVAALDMICAGPLDLPSAPLSAAQHLKCSKMARAVRGCGHEKHLR